MLKLGITGYPLRHTKSPGLHRGFLRISELKGAYDVLPFDPAAGRAAFFVFLDGLREQGYLGLNVTIPHKEWAFEYAAKHGGPVAGFFGNCAKRVRAANTLIFDNGRVYSANTDAQGIWCDVGRWLPGMEALDVLIVGTGGAARGVLAGILERHESAGSVRGVKIWGRDKRKSAALERLLPSRFKGARFNDSLPLLIVWCLSPLSKSASSVVWREIGALYDRALIFLYDLNYGERSKGTAALVGRRRRRTGMGMLRLQASASFSIWLEFAKVDQDGIRRFEKSRLWIA
ncbi:MAG: hypothetical protein HY074_13875 [Deltaproteobacteria bacterium]|nr:hypothetical protein [Deltaproteobacteria bacterium]